MTCHFPDVYPIKIVWLSPNIPKTMEPWWWNTCANWRKLFLSQWINCSLKHKIDWCLRKKSPSSSTVVLGVHSHSSTGRTITHGPGHHGSCRLGHSTNYCWNAEDKVTIWSCLPLMWKLCQASELIGITFWWVFCLAWWCLSTHWRGACGQLAHHNALSHGVTSTPVLWNQK